MMQPTNIRMITTPITIAIIVMLLNWCENTRAGVGAKMCKKISVYMYDINKFLLIPVMILEILSDKNII